MRSPRAPGPPSSFRRLPSWLGSSESLAAFALPSLIFIGQYLNFLLFHDYGLATDEALIAMAVLAFATLVLGLLLVLVRWRFLCSLIIAMLLVIFLDNQFQFIETISFLPALEGKALLQHLSLAAVILGIFFSAILLRQHLSRVLCVVFAVVLAGVLIAPPAATPHGVRTPAKVLPARDGLPTIVHLILDGHGGIEGIPLDLAGGAELRDALKSFYLNNGFRLYGGAFSEYFLTRDSLDALLNSGVAKSGSRLSRRGRNRWRLEANAFFDQLSDRGYAIRVYENEYLRLCDDERHRIEFCHTYSASSPKLLEPLAIPARDKARLLLAAYLERSSLVLAVLKAYDRLAGYPATRSLTPLRPRGRVKVSLFSLGTLDVIGRLVADIAAHPQGRAFVAHLLLPHGPFIFDRQCRVDDAATWLDRRRRHESLEMVGTPQYRAAAYGRYFEQVRCLMRALSQIFEALEAGGVWENAIVVLHGDHGSRITLRDPVGEHSDALSRQDLADAFSTLYAIRGPAFPPGYERTLASIQDLFGEHLLGHPRGVGDARAYTAPTKAFRRIRTIPLAPFGQP